MSIRTEKAVTSQNKKTVDMNLRRLIPLVMLSCLPLLGCAKETVQTEDSAEKPEEPKILVACFSFTGTTKTVASSILNLVGGTLYMIEPETPYGSENNTYYDESTRAYQEQSGPASLRPAIQRTLENAADYDVILLGFPIWYGKAPRVVFTFLDTYLFKGKTVIPFITSGSTGISSAAAELKTAFPDIAWKTGDRLNGKTAEQLSAWLKSLGIKVK